ncbi:hypothetical protein ABFS83_12G003900 [Erythranthe nasuta]
MSQPIPVDILSDSDTESGDIRRGNFNNDTIDLTTPPPFPQLKKKPRLDYFSNPSNSPVFIIDDDPTPSKNNPSPAGPTSSSTPLFVADTPFSDAALVKCSRGKSSLSGEDLADEQLIVADTPISELLKFEVPITKYNAIAPNGDHASYSSLNHTFVDLANEQLIVADTPMSELLKFEVPITKYNAIAPNGDHASPSSPKNTFVEINRRIWVESDSESENIGGLGKRKHSESAFAAKWTDDSECDSRFVESSLFLGTSVQLQKKPTQSPVKTHVLEDCSSSGALEDDIYVMGCSNEFDDFDDKARTVDTATQISSDQDNREGCIKEKGRKKMHVKMKSTRLSKEEKLLLMEEKKQLKEVRAQNKIFDDKASEVDTASQISSDQDNREGCIKEKERKKTHVKMGSTRLSKEERLRLMEEKKQLKEQEKLLKAASKAEAAEIKKREKEMQKWEKGKYALKSITAEIDKQVVELGSIGGHLLTRFAEKGLSYRITSNPVERTIVWTMVVPEEISMIASERTEISYVVIIYEAEEFCNLVMNESLMGHVQSVQHRYPHHTICYVTNRLMAYINKREQAQYKNSASYTGWKRPAIEEVLTKLATHFSKVRSRQCVDESELAEHVVGLTCSLASCQFRRKLTRLSVNANGSAIPKDCIDKNLIKKNLWLKALVAIPKVQPRFAIAIWKKYPTMKSLLSVYMDSTKSVHEKEFLLKDLSTEALLSDDRRLGEVCSKRIYRILMAQSGNIKTDDVENGADFFTNHSTS